MTEEMATTGQLRSLADKGVNTGYTPYEDNWTMREHPSMRLPPVQGATAMETPAFEGIEMEVSQFVSDLTSSREELAEYRNMLEETDRMIKALMDQMNRVQEQIRERRDSRLSEESSNLEQRCDQLSRAIGILEQKLARCISEANNDVENVKPLDDLLNELGLVRKSEDAPVESDLLNELGLVRKSEDAPVESDRAETSNQSADGLASASSRDSASSDSSFGNTSVESIIGSDTYRESSNGRNQTFNAGFDHKKQQYTETDVLMALKPDNVKWLCRNRWGIPPGLIPCVELEVARLQFCMAIHGHGRQSCFSECENDLSEDELDDTSDEDSMDNPWENSDSDSWVGSDFSGSGILHPWRSDSGDDLSEDSSDSNAGRNSPTRDSTSSSSSTSEEENRGKVAVRALGA